MPSVIVLALVFLLTRPEGIVTGHKAVNVRCQCIVKETRRIGPYLEKVEVYPASAHCREMEIIGTLKEDGQRICLDPNSKWVKRFLRKKQKNKQFKKPSEGKKV